MARWFYWAVLLAGPLFVVALIAGWITTEVGRQPLIVYEVMRVGQAVTGAHFIPAGYGALCAVCLGLAGAVFWLLRRFSNYANGRWCCGLSQGIEQLGAVDGHMRGSLHRKVSGRGLEPEARQSIRENGSPGIRPAGMPNADSKDVPFDHTVIASPPARRRSSCSKAVTW